MIELVMLVICVDTVLGVLRAFKYHRFNSSVGIDGAIRKVAMLVSVCALMAADCLVHVNLLALVPKKLRAWLEEFLENMTAELPQSTMDRGVRHG